MRRQLRGPCLVAWLVLIHGAGARAQDTVSPGLRSPAQSPVPREGPASATSAETSPSHEALQPSGTRRGPEHVGKAPPSMIVERPGALRPGPYARWIEGYWDWDPSREDFAWVTGTWLVPPAGEFWVNGYWRRDANGWSRVPGFWSGGGQAQKAVRLQEAALDGRRAGPPMARPEEPIGSAPGPDYFYIPAEYIPAGGGVAWRPGFWARSEPGWEWIPARWERRADAWAFREGFWNRVPVTSGPPPGAPPLAGATSLVSAPAGIGSPPARMTPGPVVPTSGVAPRGEADRRAAEPTRLGQAAGESVQNGASPKPGDPQSGPQAGPPRQPPYVWYGPQPPNPPGRRAPQRNRRPPGGGLFRRIRP